MRVFGIYYGNGMHFGDMVTDGETWDTLADAKSDLQGRARNGARGWSRVVDIDENDVATIGTHNDGWHPCPGDEPFIEVYGATRVGKGAWRVDVEPSYRLTVGPRGGITKENY